MDIWTTAAWKKVRGVPWRDCRTGLRLRFDRDVHEEVRRACLDFGKWLRSKYCFPMRVPVYVKSSVKLRCKDGELAYGTFFGPFDHRQEPYVRIAAWDYLDLCAKWDTERALTAILKCMAHELTHYYQWVNMIKLTEIGEERQATRYARRIIDKYAETREHPWPGGNEKNV